MFSRRSLLAGGAALALAGCDGMSALTPAQVLADANGAVDALIALVPQVADGALRIA